MLFIKKMAAQDMPPPGGFGSINIERTFGRPWVRQGLLFIAMAALSINGINFIREFRKKLRILRIEQMEHYIAAEPFLIVEQERKFLSHLYNLREDERELMKDHPGWKVGTLYGEPIFKTLPKDVIPPIAVVDFTGHRTYSEFLWHVVQPDHYQ